MIFEIYLYVYITRMNRLIKIKAIKAVSSILTAFLLTSARERGQSELRAMRARELRSRSVGCLVGGHLNEPTPMQDFEIRYGKVVSYNELHTA